jgi:hypothetical protein
VLRDGLGIELPTAVACEGTGEVRVGSALREMGGEGGEEGFRQSSE